MPLNITAHIIAALRQPEPEPELGMGVTLLGWTDRYAATIIEIEKPTITVQRDVIQRVDDNGLDGEQVYVCAPDSRGRRHTFRKRLDGTGYSEVMKNGKGKYMIVESGLGLKLGTRRPYRDPSF